jgi:hypothetical protein
MPASQVPFGLRSAETAADFGLDASPQAGYATGVASMLWCQKLPGNPGSPADTGRLNTSVELVKPRGERP